MTDECPFSYGTTNMIAGAGLYSYTTYDLQLTDDFVIEGSGSVQITKITADYIRVFGSTPADGVWVQFYEPSRLENSDAAGPLPPVEVRRLPP